MSEWLIRVAPNDTPVDMRYDQLDRLGLRSTAGAQAFVSLMPESSLIAVSPRWPADDPARLKHPLLTS